MKWLGLFLLMVFFGFASAVETAQAAGDEKASVRKDATQGYFVTQLRQDLALDKYFAGALTLADAAEKLAAVGCVPDGGWQLGQELTLADLKSAFRRMGGKLTPEGDLSAVDFIRLVTERVDKAYGPR